VGRFWAVFFMVFAAACIAICMVAPQYGWWFPGTLPAHGGDGSAHSTLGQKIDDLFYLILVIVTVTFIATQIALGYVLWQGATRSEGEKAQFSHGSHTLEVIWTIVPSGILLFIALYQMDVWAHYRIKTYFPQKMEAVAEVTARQFEWRIRYPARGKKLMPTPQPDDIYTVNDLRVPTGHPVAISLRTEDVQHSFFVPKLRVKQDAVPGLVIPVWWEMTSTGTFDLTCAELCGWGHYKMKAQVVAMPEADFEAWKSTAAAEQFYDGVPRAAAELAQRPAAE
jgi:cytochrome c oxidase subunit II